MGSRLLSFYLILNLLCIAHPQSSAQQRANASDQLEGQETTGKPAGESLADGRVLVNDGKRLFEAGRYVEAAERIERGLDILQRVLKPNDPELASAFNNLAVMYHAAGNYVRAVPLYKHSLQIKEQTLGPNSLSLVEPLSNLATLSQVLGDYSQAGTLLRRALAILVGSPEPNRLLIATLYNNLGMLLFEQGDYAQAEQYLQQALDIRRSLLGQNHSDVAVTLDNLGELYFSQGDYNRALKAYVEAFLIFDKTVGRAHPDTAIAAGNVAEVFRVVGDYKHAKELFQLALEIQRKVYPEGHRWIASTLESLGVVYQQEGDYAKAEEAMRDALALRERLFGKEHPNVAPALYKLAYLYYVSGDYARAEPSYKRGLQLSEKVDRLYHQNLAVILFSLALLYQATDRSDLALTTLTRALSIQQRNIENVFSASSEPTMQGYVASINYSFSGLISLAAERGSRQQRSVNTALTWTLRRKAMVIDTLSQFRLAQTLVGRDPLIAQKILKLNSVKQQMSNLPLRPGTDLSDKGLQESLEKLREEIVLLESDLNRALSARRPVQLASEADADTVRKRLPAGSALVEFVSVDVADFKAVGRQARWLPARYFAFVLTNDLSVAPRMIDLGEASKINAQVAALRSRINAFKSDWVAGKFAGDSPLKSDMAEEDMYRREGRRLYDLVFAPLRGELGGAGTIYLAPDGQLNLAPFEALVDERGKYLIETYRFAYLSSGRDLLKKSVGGARGTVVFADPDYELDSSERAKKAGTMLSGLSQSRPNTPIAAESAGAEEPAGVRGTAPNALIEGLKKSLNLRGGALRWDRLDATRAEAKDVEETLSRSEYGPVRLYLRDEALEDVIKRVSRPRLLHISTHGFFLEDSKKEDVAALDFENAAMAGKEVLRRSAGGQSPLLRSGLILAGANKLNEQTTLIKVDDGWLTAEEVAQMDLQGTELVVLSACETGVGDVHVGEGVYGLRRAFQYAGARTLVSTLFAIPSDKSRQLMRSFYIKLKAREGKLSALHAAQLEIIRLHRRERSATHPFFWAGFILSGDPE